VVILVVLGGRAWPLLSGFNGPDLRLSSRVSNSGRWCNVLRSRAREHGLYSASEMEQGSWPLGVCSSWYLFDGGLPPGFSFRRFACVDSPWWMRTSTIKLCVLFFLFACVCRCLVS
jgi:hypothetical protein